MYLKLITFAAYSHGGWARGCYCSQTCISDNPAIPSSSISVNLRLKYYNEIFIYFYVSLCFVCVAAMHVQFVFDRRLILVRFFCCCFKSLFRIASGFSGVRSCRIFIYERKWNCLFNLFRCCGREGARAATMHIALTICSSQTGNVVFIKRHSGTRADHADITQICLRPHFNYSTN